MHTTSYFIGLFLYFSLLGVGIFSVGYGTVWFNRFVKKYFHSSELANIFLTVIGFLFLFLGFWIIFDIYQIVCFAKRSLLRLNTK